MATTAPRLDPFLLPEILGFSHQLLLDDIINIANNAVLDGVHGMEGLLQKWVDERVKRNADDWDSIQEVEQGLVAFQTLLEYHTDIAFDFFEAWSLRNIFAIPPDLPIVMPHHRNLDLTHPAERQSELTEELGEVRKKLFYQRRLRRTYQRELRESDRERKRAEGRWEELSCLESLDVLGTVPQKSERWFQEMISVSSMNPYGSNTIPLSEPGKRQWETGSKGYFKWAVMKLLEKSDGNLAAIASLARMRQVGSMQLLQAAKEAMKENA